MHVVMVVELVVKLMGVTRKLKVVVVVVDMVEVGNVKLKIVNDVSNQKISVVLMEDDVYAVNQDGKTHPYMFYADIISMMFVYSTKTVQSKGSCFTQYVS